MSSIIEIFLERSVSFIRYKSNKN